MSKELAAGIVHVGAWFLAASYTGHTAGKLLSKSSNVWRMPVYASALVTATLAVMLYWTVLQVVQIDWFRAILVMLNLGWLVFGYAAWVYDSSPQPQPQPPKSSWRLNAKMFGLLVVEFALLNADLCTTVEEWLRLW